MKKWMQILLAGTAALISVIALADPVTDAISERIAPVGSVCVQGEECAVATAAVAASGPRSGEDVYNAACMACHTTGAAGAPMLADAAAWAPRMEAGIDALYGNAINGVGGMPPKGACMNCSDDEIKAAVDFLVASTQ